MVHFLRKQKRIGATVARGLPPAENHRNQQESLKGPLFNGHRKEKLPPRRASCNGVEREGHSRFVEKTTPSPQKNEKGKKKGSGVGEWGYKFKHACQKGAKKRNTLQWEKSVEKGRGSGGNRERKLVAAVD